MALIAAGVIGYKFTHKSSVSKRIDEPSRDTVDNLFKRAENHEITSLQCVCKTTKRNKDLQIDLPDVSDTVCCSDFVVCLGSDL